jgi:sugar-specific transcriptional regulator TrmB
LGLLHGTSGKSIQKIITFPAALKKIRNPAPRVAHPEWLNSKVQKLNHKYQQQSIVSMFGPVKKQNAFVMKVVVTSHLYRWIFEDIEGEHAHGISRSRLVRIVRNVNTRETAQEQPEDDPTDSTDRIPLDNDKGNFVPKSYQHGSPQCTFLCLGAAISIVTTIMESLRNKSSQL